MPEPQTEHDVILALADGSLPSPSTYMGSEFFTIRISGTGCRYRSAHGEFSGAILIFG